MVLEDPLVRVEDLTVEYIDFTRSILNPLDSSNLSITLNFSNLQSSCKARYSSLVASGLYVM